MEVPELTNSAEGSGSAVFLELDPIHYYFFEKGAIEGLNRSIQQLE